MRCAGTLGAALGAELFQAGTGATVTAGRALVLGDDVRSFLGVARSLGRQGVTVDACPFVFTSPALRSRYIRRLHRLPPYAIDPEGWLLALDAILDTGAYDLVIPCDDRTIIPLMRHRHALAGQNIALPNDRAFEVFYDKHETREAAAEENVPIAPGRLLRVDDDADGLAEEIGFPLAVKPRRSYALENPGVRQGVVICHDAEQLGSRLAEIDNAGDYIIEGFFAGVGVGVSVLAHEGRILQAFEHHRVQEPITGGGSSYRKSAPVDPERLRCVERLAAATALTGVAMFEFRCDMKAGTFVLLEVNARFWGSLPLPIAAGIAFPFLLYRLLVDGIEEPTQPYRIGLYGRNVTADLFCTAQNFSHLKREGAGRAIRYLLRSGSQWLRVFTLRERHDSFASDDPLPALIEYWRLGFVLGNAVWKRLPFPGSDRRRLALRAISRAIGNRPSLRILVVCQGNICRSPFAAEILARELDGGEGITVDSAGMLPMQGRQSPELAQQVAGDLGISLARHRSQFADDNALQAADLIVVFDEINEVAIKDRGLPIRAPVVRLGDLLAPSDGGGEILDPFGCERSVYEGTYRRIVAAAQQLAARVAPAMKSG